MSAYLVLLGAPGSGKGTQAARLAAHRGIPAISTGDIFRANVAAETELGLLAKQYMEAGEYVPDSVTNAMVRDRLGREDAAEGFILDGYPRTADQVATLDEILAEQGRRLDAVVELVANQDEVVARMLRRSQVEGRVDDTEDVIRRRLEVYREQTEPLTRIYGERGLLAQVDGLGTVDDVTERLLAALPS